MSTLLGLPTLSTMRIVALALLGGGSLFGLIRLITAFFTFNRGKILSGIRDSFICFVVGVGVFALIWFGFAFSEPPSTFRWALREGEIEVAWDLLTPRMQKEFDGRAGLSAWAEKMRPESWVFSGSCGTVGIGEVAGSGKTAGGEGYRIVLFVRDDDGTWLIQGIAWEGMDYHELGTVEPVDCSD